MSSDPVAGQDDLAWLLDRLEEYVGTGVSPYLADEDGGSAAGETRPAA